MAQRLTQIDYDQMHRLSKEGSSQIAIGNIIGCHNSLVSKVLSGKLFRPKVLTPRQAQLVDLIRKHPGCSIKRLCLLSDSITHRLSPVLWALEQRGLIVIGYGPNHSRAVFCVLATPPPEYEIIWRG